MSAKPNKIARRAFVAEVLRHRGNALIATGLGSATWDCFAAGDTPDFLYSWGGMGIAQTMTVTEQGAVGELAEFLFKTPGPVLAIAKIALTEDPWGLPEKDGAAIAHRFRMALGLEKA